MIFNLLSKWIAASSVVTLFPFLSVTTQCIFQPSHSPVIFFSIAPVAFAKFVQLLLPGALYCHWYFSPSPSAVTANSTLSPALLTATSFGWLVIFNVLPKWIAASSVVTLFPFLSVTTQCTFQPSHSPVTFFNVAFVAFAKFVQLLLPGALYCHWYFSPSPSALTANSTLSPALLTITSFGWPVIFNLLSK